VQVGVDPATRHRRDTAGLDRLLDRVHRDSAMAGESRNLKQHPVISGNYPKRGLRQLRALPASTFITDSKEGAPGVNGVNIEQTGFLDEIQEALCAKTYVH
jgi:hypothetical protein